MAALPKVLAKKPKRMVMTGHVHDLRIDPPLIYVGDTSDRPIRFEAGSMIPLEELYDRRVLPSPNFRIYEGKRWKD